MTFCYFIPDISLNLVSSVDQIPEATGLRTVLRDRDTKASSGFTARQATGPGGRQGSLLAAEPAAVRQGEPKGDIFNPCEFDNECRLEESTGDWVSAKQRWHEVKNDDGTTNHFIGWYLASVPGPEDLRRVNMVEGHSVFLNDGREWIVPVVGPYKTKLPMGFSAKGQPIIRREYRRIFEESEKLRTDWYSGGIEYATLWRFGVDLLSINYRVGAEEVASDVLDLITTTNFAEIFEVAAGIIDWRLDEESKKNAVSDQPVG